MADKRRFRRFLHDTPPNLRKALFLKPAVTGDEAAQAEAAALFGDIRQRKTLTTDWFSFNIPVWTGLLGDLRTGPANVLEVGSFEGASAMFLLEYLPQSSVTCIDSFFVKAGMENWPGDVRTEDTETVFDRNLAPYGERCRKIAAQSAVALNILWMEGRKFDVVYIDGSHEAEDCLSDSILAWRLLKPGGLMIWDDYLWELQNYGKHTPAWGINAFVRVFRRELDVLHARYQVAARKIA